MPQDNEIEKIKRATLEEAEKQARGIAEVLTTAMPKGWGFFLHLSSFGNGGFSTYISNCDRDDILKLMEELIPQLQSRKKGAYFQDDTKHQ